MQELSFPMSLKQNISSFMSTMEDMQTRLLAQGSTNLHHPARTCCILSHLSRTLLEKLDSSVQWDGDCTEGQSSPNGPLQLTQQSITDGDVSLSSQRLSQGSIFGPAFSQESRVGNPLQLGFSQESMARFCEEHGIAPSQEESI